MKKVIYVIGAIIVSITVFLYLNLDSPPSTSSSNSDVSGISNSNMSGANNNIKNDMPEDFEKIKNAFQSGTFADMANLSREYYARPEFYKDYEAYKQGTQKVSGRIGYGTTIIESSYNVYNFSAGQYMDVYTFIRAAPGIDSYQNFGLSFQSPNNTLFETYTDPSDINLAPTFSEINNSSNWVYKIKMRIVSKKDIPKGRYVFKLETVGTSIQPEKFFDFILYAYEQEPPQAVNNKYHK